MMGRIIYIILFILILLAYNPLAAKWEAVEDDYCEGLITRYSEIQVELRDLFWLIDSGLVPSGDIHSLKERINVLEATKEVLIQTKKEVCNEKTATHF